MRELAKGTRLRTELKRKERGRESMPRYAVWVMPTFIRRPPRSPPNPRSADTLSLTPERASGRSRGPLTNCAALPILYLLCQTSIRVNTGFTSSPIRRQTPSYARCTRMLFPQERIRKSRNASVFSRYLSHRQTEMDRRPPLRGGKSP